MQKIFSDKEEGEHTLKELQDKGGMVDASKAKMAMPIFIRDFTDMQASKNHAYNLGVIRRGADNALLPNWTHLPIGYHSRASSIVIDGTPFHRPRGQTKPPDAEKPIFGASRKLDFELEMGVVLSHGNEMGHPIKVTNATEYIFGYNLLNDWSARDI